MTSLNEQSLSWLGPCRVAFGLGLLPKQKARNNLASRCRFYEYIPPSTRRKKGDSESAASKRSLRLTRCQLSSHRLR